MPKVAFVPGNAGKDGAHLSELLLSKGCIVHGIKPNLIGFQRGDCIARNKKVGWT